MERLKLKAFAREKTTKGGRKKIRKKGYLPAVVYGRGGEPRIVTLESVELKRTLSTPAGSNVLIDMEINEGDEKTTKETVMLKELQRHPIQRDFYIHADLIRISLQDKVDVDVPLNFEGEPLGVKEGGTFQIQIRELSVRCLPQDIPEQINVPVEHLKIGDLITVDELDVPSEVEILNDPSEDVASVLTPTIEKEPEEEAEEVEMQPAGEEEPQESPGEVSDEEEQE